MALLQGIATPEEDCFIQVSVFVPEGRLWLLVWKAQSKLIVGPLWLSCHGFAHPTWSLLSAWVCELLLLSSRPSEGSGQGFEITPTSMWWPCFDCGSEVSCDLLCWWQHYYWSINHRGLCTALQQKVREHLGRRVQQSNKRHTLTEDNLAEAASCKSSTVLVVFHLWARHCRWQMSCQSTLSPHICVIMTWKDLEAGNLWKQWKWMVGDALVHGMRTMHYLVKARHDIFEQTISHQWVPCMYLQLLIAKNWWNTKIVSMLASSWDAQILLSLSWIFHKFLFSWQLILLHKGLHYYLLNILISAFDMLWPTSLS